MNNMNDDIKLNLTIDQALVLFDLLARVNANETNNFLEDEAEQKVLWTIEGQLEKVLIEPFKANYNDIIKNARQRLNESY